MFTECFEVNEFEQLMINYTNETMQNFALQIVVKEKDVLDDFHHNEVIDLIGNPEKGILTLLDDKIKLHIEGNFAETVYKKWSPSSVLINKKLMPTSFTVKHYASEVTYETVKHKSEIIYLFTLHSLHL